MQLTSLAAGFQQLSSDLRVKGNAIARSTSRLSSGQRITRSGDDVANMSVSTQLAARMSGLKSGRINMAQASSVLQVASGALDTIDDVLQRMNAIATQASSGALNKVERAFLNIEFQELKDEIDYVLEITRFGDRQIFRGVTTEEPRVARLSSVTEDNPFMPDDISEMVAWFDATDEETLLDGAGNAANAGAFTGSVASWLDKSGQNNHLTQPNAAERPVFDAATLNGENTVRFDGNNDRLPGTVPTNTNQLTTFIVATRTGGGGREFFYDFGNNGEASRDIVGLNNNRPVYYNLPGGGTNNFSFTNTITFGQYDLYGTVTNDQIVSGRVNGEEFLNVDMGASHDRDPSNAFVLGDDSTSGDELHGNIAEMLAFDRALTQEERLRVEGYLAHKYGLDINLSPTHEYADAPPLSGIGSNVVTQNIVAGEVAATVSLAGGPYDFSITQGNEDNAFAINSVTGDISINNVASLGSATKDVTLTVQAEDGSDVTEIEVVINIETEIIITKDSAFTYLLGEQSGSIFEFDVGDVFLSDVLSNEDIDVITKDSTVEAFDVVQGGIDNTTRLRAYVGSKQAQADYVSANIENTLRTTADAFSVIADTDIAAVSTEFASEQAGLQASISIGAQAQRLQADTVLGIVNEGIQLDTLA